MSFSYLRLVLHLNQHLMSMSLDSVKEISEMESCDFCSVSTALLANHLPQGAWRARRGVPTVWLASTRRPVAARYAPTALRASTRKRSDPILRPVACIAQVARCHHRGAAHSTCAVAARAYSGLTQLRASHVRRAPTKTLQAPGPAWHALQMLTLLKLLNTSGWVILRCFSERAVCRSLGTSEDMVCDDI